MKPSTDQRFWVDHSGARLKVPSHKRRMAFGKFSLHAAVRAFVFIRDCFTCQVCGRRDSTGDRTYDGRWTRLSDDNQILVLDHIHPFVRGGTNHPGNLRVLCDPCNGKKGAKV